MTEAAQAPSEKQVSMVFDGLRKVKSRRIRLIATIGIGLLALIAGLNIGGLRDRLLGRAGSRQIESLVVLPLENLSGDPEQEYFADGMTEALIANLAKIGALKVISRTSAMRYKDTDKPLPEIAQELGVDGIVEGSVLRAGDRVRITAQLIDAETDQHIWAETYERDLRDVLALQSQVAEAVAQEIRITVTPQEHKRLTSSGIVDPAAHEAYLKGRFYWNKRTVKSLKRGLHYFEEAIEKDPGYASAYAGLADSYNLLGAYGLPVNETLPKAKTAATKALELDKDLAEAHASLGMLRRLDWDWLGAEEELKRAIQLNPGYASARHWYATLLSSAERHEEAIAEIRKAHELDPLSLIINADMASVFHYARQHDLAIEQSRKTLDLDPNYWIAYRALGDAYLQKGRYEEAISAFQTAMSHSAGHPRVIARLGHAYAISGRKDEAYKVLDQLNELSLDTYVSSYDRAVVYAGLALPGPPAPHEYPGVN
jgi:TolB-like protein/Flp pilus assembly protein TadD